MQVRLLIAFLAILAGSCSVLAATDDGCCVGHVGDANGSGEDEPSIGDVSVMIDAKYITGSCIAEGSGANIRCISEADINQSGCWDPTCDDISIGDVSMLIDYLFITGKENMTLPECLWETVTDIDGNVYQTVCIGTQVWMAANLKVTHYRNGEDISNVTNATTWAALTTGAYCEYNNNISNVATYGRLYNWHAVSDSRNIAPAGWHMPTDAEWQTLVDYLGGDAVAGGKLKEVGTTHWTSPNAGATNESGFSALPGGYRYEDGSYGSMSGLAIYWSSTEISSYYAWSRILYWAYSDIDRSLYDKVYGFSVRCVRDY